ncbi:MAG TPA: hypothetical protein VJ302_23590 [Blastocatellia bacterium]|nr:hypothetical protein [Blastocatellia bacterium]
MTDEVCRPGRSTGRFILSIVGFALIVILFLIFLAQTPKSRLNVIQFASVFFFLILMVRYWRAARSAPAEPPATRRSGPSRELVLALLVSTALYASTLPFYFVSDDYAHLFTARQPVFETLWSLLTEGQGKGFLRPVGFASLFFDYYFWYHWPPAYHLVNLLLHCVGIVGIYFLCKNLGLDPETSATASLIFSIMPIQPEAVVWIAARFDLLATPLTIWAFVLYLNFRRTGNRQAYLGALVLFLFAMLSKESAFAFPLLLVSLEFLVLPDRRIKPVLGFVLLTLLTFSYRWAVLGGIGGYLDPDGQASAFGIGLGTFEGLLVRAPAQMLLGYNWLQPGVAIPIVLASLTAGLLLTLALRINPGSATQDRRRLVWFSLSWILLASLPAHFLLLVSPGLTNSRVLYLSSAGAAILVALLLAGIEQARMRQASKLFLVLLLSVGLFHNLRAWHWTSQLSHRFLLELKQLEPAPPPGAEFVFRDLPHTIRGVFFFHAGLEEAVNLTFDRKDLTARRESGAPRPATEANGRPEIKLNWVGTTESLIQRAKD